MFDLNSLDINDKNESFFFLVHPTYAESAYDVWVDLGKPDILGIQLAAYVDDDGSEGIETFLLLHGEEEEEEEEWERAYACDIDPVLEELSFDDAAAVEALIAELDSDINEKS